jgi:hypothetical protein
MAIAPLPYASRVITDLSTAKNSKFTGISYIIASRDHSNAELGKRTEIGHKFSASLIA